MNTQRKRNAALAFAGLLALSVYIMACTSFSPDDTKVLYPACDAASGAVGISVYDRESRSTETVFVPINYDGSESNITVAPNLVRAQWLANGREIVVVYAGSQKSGDSEGVTVALVPWGARKPVKIFRIPETKDAGEALMAPLCVVGDQVFLRVSEKLVARLNFRTGALTPHEFTEAKGEVALYPAPDGDTVFYFEGSKGPDTNTTFGRMNPNDFTRVPQMIITNRIPDQTVLAYDREGRTVVFLTGREATNQLVVWRGDQPIFTRTVASGGQTRVFGSAMLAPSGKALYATYQQANGTNSMSYGLMEIPFSSAAPRETTLIAAAPVEEEMFAFYFQGAVSHDGKAAAVASTYLAFSKENFKPADCALFLVDLSGAKWNVTKVPIPMPSKRDALVK